MSFNTPSKIVVGILSLLPVTLAIGTFGFFFYNIFSMSFSPEAGMNMFFPAFLHYMLSYLFIIILLCLGLFIFYIIHMAQNQALDSEKRFLWISLLVLAYGIAMPIYWYMHIWKERELDHIHTQSSHKKGYESGT